MAFHRPVRWQWEIVLLAACLWVYNMTRNAVPEKLEVATGNARDIQALQDWLHINFERSLNGFVAEHEPVAQVMNYYYATLHFIVTIAVLVWLFRVFPRRYAGARTVLFVTSAVALLGYWFYPLAPPRFDPAYVDTLVRYHTWGSFGSPEVANHSNQYAAMPSLHTAWALWCGICIAVCARRMWVRVLGALYPVATVLVIVGTANHYVLDAVGGATVLGIGFLAQYLWWGRSPFRDAPLPPADDEPAEPDEVDIPDFVERGEPAPQEADVSVETGASSS